jgi:hypothetical protein
MNSERREVQAPGHMWDKAPVSGCALYSRVDNVSSLLLISSPAPGCSGADIQSIEDLRHRAGLRTPDKGQGQASDNNAAYAAGS